MVKLRADMVKITRHCRRPIPVRVVSIGAWLECMTFITWLGALTNAGSVYLFHNTDGASVQEHLMKAAYIALCASHGYMLLQYLIRHALERMLWFREDGAIPAKADRAIKEAYLEKLAKNDHHVAKTISIENETSDEHATAFWKGDQGMEEVQRAVKDA